MVYGYASFWFKNTRINTAEVHRIINTKEHKKFSASWVLDIDNQMFSIYLKNTVVHKYSRYLTNLKFLNS